MTGTWSYNYDALNRLTSGTASAGYYAGLDLAWSYDNFGNRESQTPSGTSGVSLTQPGPLTFTAGNNRAAQFSYDSAGHVQTDFSNSYLYDAEGRICAVNSTVQGVTLYLYDAEGRRVGRGSGSFSCNPSSNGFALTHRYVLDLSGAQVTELDGSGNWLHTNAFAGGTLLATYSASGTPLSFALNDWVGTKRVQAKADGELDTTFLSLPFGDQLVTGTGSTEQFYTGQQRDAESGNDYFNARSYASAVGRFLSPDPSQLYYADPTNPQSFNLYSYGWNNPLANIDPTGMDACATDNGNGTATIINAADGGGVDCPGNGSYITTTQQVTAVGFNGNGDLSVYGADGNLYNPDGSAYDVSQSITVGADGDSSYIGTQAISSPGLQYVVTNPAPYDGPGYSMSDICAASALLHNGAATSLDALGAVPALGSWSKGTQAAVKGVQLAGGVVSVGMATTGTPAEAASAGAGLGLAGASASVPAETMRFAGGTVEIIPFVGNILSGTMALHDAHEMGNYYNDCMAGKN